MIFAMAVKMACALAMVNTLIRLCHGGSASGYCAPQTCGSANGGVEIRFPFVLQAAATTGGVCYTDYPDLQFLCVDQFLYLNFTLNATLSNDMYMVTKIDYWNQTLSLVPSIPEAICRPFDANRFDGLDITNTSSLLLNCPNDLHQSCVTISASSDVCNGTAGTVNNTLAPRWACSMELNNFTANDFSGCHLMDALPPVDLNIAGSVMLELQFKGNKTLSLTNFTLESPAPTPTSNGVVLQNKGLSTKKKVFIIVGVLIGSWAAIAIFLLSLVCWCRQRTRPNLNLTTNPFTQINIAKIKGYKNQTTLFTLRELEKATKNFSNDFKLGSGGFGTVYKGTLDNGLEVAIKKSNRVDIKGSEQYLNEVSLLSQVNHRNLVGLHGCCLEVEVPMLVYEYVPNGDLFQHLQGERPGMQLTWTKRLQIAIDTAEALRYLHSAAYPPIYHRDVKTSNILLDNSLNVKVADFGISRLIKPNATHVSTMIQGTIGYLDPDYMQNFQLTDKSDVYSFGMVLLELITSLKPIDFERGEDVNLKSMALPFVQKKNIEAIADSKLFNEDARDSYEILIEMQKVAELALKCLANHRRYRPSMKEVVVELVAIRSIVCSGSKVDHETCDMDYEDVEIIPVLDNQSSHVTSSSHSSHISYTNSSTSYEVNL